MASINYAFKEIISKIVYYGPGLSGKTTNLQYVFKKVPSETRGELISLATDADRTLYFDFLPVNVGTVRGFATKFQLYTVPGQVYYNATRKLVLRGVDGLVFVADSQKSKLEEDIESLLNLKDNLAEYGYDITQIPLVIQYNKRDLPNILDIPELERTLNPGGLPSFEAVAVTGEGVFKTLKMISKMVLDEIRTRGIEYVKQAKAEPAQVPSMVTSGAADSMISSERPAISESISAPASFGITSIPSASITLEETKKLSSDSPEMALPANVVVSDSHDDIKTEKETSAPRNGNNEEHIEKAILSGENGEPGLELLPINSSDFKMGNSEDAPESVLSELPFRPPDSGSYHDENPDTTFSKFVPMAKPRMAESKKVKGRKSRFSLFGWLKK